jgi:hypothetical protein
MRVLVAIAAIAFAGSVRADPVPVTFLGNPSQLTVAGQRCTVPCTLELFPGRTKIDVRGRGTHFGEFIRVPSAPATVDLSAHLRRVLGVLFLSLGGIYGTAGTVGLSLAYSGIARLDVTMPLAWTGVGLGVLASLTGAILMTRTSARVLPGTIRALLSPTGTGFAFEF